MYALCMLFCMTRWHDSSPSTIRPTPTQPVPGMVHSSGADTVSSSQMGTVMATDKIWAPRVRACVCSTLYLSRCAMGAQTDAVTTTSETSTAIGWQASSTVQIRTSLRARNLSMCCAAPSVRLTRPHPPSTLKVMRPSRVLQPGSYFGKGTATSW